MHSSCCEYCRVSGADPNIFPVIAVSYVNGVVHIRLDIETIFLCFLWFCYEYWRMIDLNCRQARPFRPCRRVNYWAARVFCG